MKKIFNVVATTEQVKVMLLNSTNDVKRLIKDLNLPVHQEDIRNLKLLGNIIIRYPMTFDFVLNIVNRVINNDIDCIEETSLHYEINVSLDVANKYIKCFPDASIRKTVFYSLFETVGPMDIEIVRDGRRFVLINDFPFWIKLVKINKEKVVNILLSKPLWKPLIEGTYYQNGNRYVSIPANLYPFTTINTIRDNIAYLTNILGFFLAIEKGYYNKDLKSILVDYNDIQEYRKMQRLMAINYNNVEALKDLTNTNNTLKIAVERYREKNLPVRLVSGVRRWKDEKLMEFFFTKIDPSEKEKTLFDF